MQAATLAVSASHKNKNFVDYDSVIVGTSPICLITALVERAEGKRVLMVDAADEVGGTWRTTKLLGFRNVELGCHIIDADRNVYRLLHELGIHLQPMQPQPFVYSVEPRFLPRQLAFRHRWIRDLYDILAGGKNFDLPGENERSLRLMLKGVGRVARYATLAARGINYPTRYPERGASEIIMQLESLVRASGVEIRTSCRLTDVILNREAAYVTFSLSGERLSTGRLHMTSSTELSQIRDGGSDIHVETKRFTWQALYLVVSRCPTPPFSYILFSQDDLLHRASDLSRYAKPSPAREGSRLIALTIDEGFADDESTALLAFEKLKRMRLIAQESLLEDYAYRPYHFSRIDMAGRQSLSKDLEPLIQIIESDTLTRSLKLLLRTADVDSLLQRFGGRRPPGRMLPRPLTEKLGRGREEDREIRSSSPG